MSGSTFFDGVASDALFGGADAGPDTIEHALVLAAVKDAARR